MEADNNFNVPLEEGKINVSVCVVAFVSKIEHCCSRWNRTHFNEPRSTVCILAVQANASIAPLFHSLWQDVEWDGKSKH